MPDSRTILPSPELLSLISVSTDAQSITITARTSSCNARCPMCGRKSAKVHSRYTRTVADLPWQNIPVTVSLHVRRFFCEEGSCGRAIFAERLPELVECYALRTRRLDSWFTHVSFALGGEAGARLLKDLGVVVSGDTLLSHIRSTRLQDHGTPRVLSVDDFAFRRGTRYGTVLVDLERRRMVEILPDRSATIKRLRRIDPNIQKCCRLFEEFARLFRDGGGSTDGAVDVARGEKARTALQQWMEEAKESSVPELKSFAIKLSQDKEAVLAAMILPYSQGQTEGRVKKLKLIKRSMYGRGKFDLLRQRVLYASAA